MSQATRLLDLTLGSTVAVLYDGKWGRAVEGCVVAVGPRGRRKRTPRWIRVRFLPWANEEAGFVEVRFRLKGRGDGRAFVGVLRGAGESGIMRSLGSDGDHYVAGDPQSLIDAGYRVQPYDRLPGGNNSASEDIFRQLRGEVMADQIQPLRTQP